MYVSYASQSFVKNHITDSRSVFFSYTATGRFNHVVITIQTQKRKTPSRWETITAVVDHLMTWRALTVSARRTPQLQKRRGDRPGSGTSQNGSPSQTPTQYALQEPHYRLKKARRDDIIFGIGTNPDTLFFFFFFSGRIEARHTLTPLSKVRQVTQWPCAHPASPTWW